MRRSRTIRAAFLASGLLGACLPNVGCGGQPSGSGDSTVVPTTDEEYKQMERENQANQAELDKARKKPR